MQKKRLAIITARGGSKRIPRKNIREFCGKPIIAYSIEAALKCEMFDEVMVSTDDEEIAQIAEGVGAVVPFFRSDETSNDFATTADVILEVVNEYAKRGLQFDTLCCVYPTAPFVTADKLKRAVEMLEEKAFDSVMSVAEFSFPPLRGMILEGDKVSYKWEEYALSRSQDLQKIYHDVGQFYILDTAKFLETKKMVTKNTGAVRVDEMEMQDIDNETDWKLAELKYQLLNEERG